MHNLYLDENLKDFKEREISYPSIIENIEIFFNNLQGEVKENKKYSLNEITDAINKSLSEQKNLTVRDIIEFFLKNGKIRQESLFKAYEVYFKMKENSTISLMSDEKTFLIEGLKDMLQSISEEKIPKYWQLPCIIVCKIIESEKDNTPKV